MQKSWEMHANILKQELKGFLTDTIQQGINNVCNFIVGFFTGNIMFISDIHLILQEIIKNIKELTTGENPSRGWFDWVDNSKSKAVDIVTTNLTDLAIETLLLLIENHILGDVIYNIGYSLQPPQENETCSLQINDLLLDRIYRGIIKQFLMLIDNVFMCTDVSCDIQTKKNKMKKVAPEKIKREMKENGWVFTNCTEGGGYDPEVASNFQMVCAKSPLNPNITEFTSEEDAIKHYIDNYSYTSSTRLNIEEGDTFIIKKMDMSDDFRMVKENLTLLGDKLHAIEIEFKKSASYKDKMFQHKCIWLSSEKIPQNIDLVEIMHVKDGWVGADLILPKIERVAIHFLIPFLQEKTLPYLLKLSTILSKKNC